MEQQYRPEPEQMSHMRTGQIQHHCR